MNTDIYDGQKRKRKPSVAQRNKDHLSLNSGIKHKTEPQRQMMLEFEDGYNIVAHGSAGSGKSYVACYLALKKLFDGDTSKIVIVRSAVQVRSQGFLPGSLAEKSEVYTIPYKQIINELCDNGSAWDILTKKNMIEFISTSFVRGITLSDCVVIVDEFQNCDWYELSSVVTRAGEGCQIVFCGDTAQGDLFRTREKSGFMQFMQVIEKMPEYFASIQFLPQDIVRSGLVKKFIMVCEDMDV
jgi:phosphate starvation-inducible protein PhoH